MSALNNPLLGESKLNKERPKVAVVEITGEAFIEKYNLVRIPYFFDTNGKRIDL